MQRFLSLATLAVLGGLAWLFFREGGLDNMADSNGRRQPPSASELKDLWSQSSAAGDSTPSAAPDPGALQPTSGAQQLGAGGPTIRIASFNIQVFGKTKASKPAVMYTLAEIIRKFDVAAIQEIRTQDDYHIPNFVRLVNQGGRRYNHVVGPRIGNTSSTEQYAFLFDEDRVECDFTSYYTIRDPENLLHREPLVAHFRARGAPPEQAFTFTLVNVHTDPDDVDVELDVLAEAYRVVRRAGRNEDDVIMLGDFNASDQELGRLGQIPGIAALITGVFSNTRQTKLYDNIVIHQPSTTEYVGKSGVYDVMRAFNLTLDQALEVSDHLPVWAEFSAYERDYAGRIAVRGGRPEAVGRR